jgi:hypothetical protein
VARPAVGRAVLRRDLDNLRAGPALISGLDALVFGEEPGDCTANSRVLCLVVVGTGVGLIAGLFDLVRQLQ